MISAYLIGAPGSGKSTLHRWITHDLAFTMVLKPFKHRLLWHHDHLAGAELGATHPTFPGTDRLSMSVQPLACDLIREQPWPCVIAEGDRLATQGFLDTLQAHSTTFTLVHLNTPDDLASARRDHRGSNQNPTWLKGRHTKIQRLLDTYPHVTLDGTLNPTDLLRQARTLVPAYHHLRDPHA